MIGKAKAAAALAAAAFLFGACGGEGDSATETAPPAQQGQRDGSGGQERPEDGSQDGARRTSGAARGQDRSGGDTSARFTPRQHSDSGGGGQQFRVPGGDNSVQEFGSEAEGGELEAAAAALHNFFDAHAQRAWRAACSYLASHVVDSMRQAAAGREGAQGGSCAEGLRTITNPNAPRMLRFKGRRPGRVPAGVRGG